jgi:hypothetical protein
MLEGKTVNLRVVEREDLSLCAEWFNNPQINGEYEPILQASRTEIEKWYGSIGPKEKWFLIEKKDAHIISTELARFYTEKVLKYGRLFWLCG